MPAPMTELQQKFAIEFAMNGANATAAAKLAGYSAKTAHEIGRQLLEKPHVQAAIHRELTRLRFRSGAIGLQAMSQIAENEKAPAAARVSAARALMEHAGLVGSARELAEARAAAEVDEEPANVVDFREVLRAFGARARA